MDNELTGLPLQLGQGLPDRLEERLLSIAANVVNIVSFDRVQGDAAQVPQERVLRLDPQAHGVVEGHPELALAEAVRTGQILIAFHGPVTLFQ